jgi:phage tail-like protein
MKPPLSFYFRIVFKGLDNPEQDDSGFQSVTGLAVAIPGEIQNSTGICPVPLLLKRAVRKYSESPLTRWLFSHFNKKDTHPLPEALIELLDEKHQPYMSWTIYKILPKSWRLEELNAEKREVLIETIELTYEEVRFQEEVGMVKQQKSFGSIK